MAAPNPAVPRPEPRPFAQVEDSAAELLCAVHRMLADGGALALVSFRKWELLERLLAGFMNRFEALSGMLSATRSFSGLEVSYVRQWLHTDQDVVIEDASGGGSGGAAGSARVTIKGVTATGYLLAVDEKGTRYELHPDGNSLDFFQGLVRKKLPS